MFVSLEHFANLRIQSKLKHVNRNSACRISLNWCNHDAFYVLKYTAVDICYRSPSMMEGAH